MKTFLRYAWPVLLILAIQGWLFATTVPQPGAWPVWVRNVLWLGVDLFIGSAQLISYRHCSKLRREVDEVRRKRDEAITRMMNGRRS